MSHFLLVLDHLSHEDLHQEFLGGSCPCFTQWAAEIPNGWITSSQTGQLPHQGPQQQCSYISPEVRWLGFGDLGLPSSISLIPAPNLSVASEQQPGLQQAGCVICRKAFQELAYGIKRSLAGLQGRLTAKIFARGKNLSALDKV